MKEARVALTTSEMGVLPDAGTTSMSLLRHMFGQLAPHLAGDRGMTSKDQVSVSARRHHLLQDLDLLLDKSLDAVPAVVLVVFLGPFSPHAFAKFRALPPQLFRYRAQVDLIDADALFGGDHHHVAVVRVLEFHQVVDVGRRVYRHPVRQRHTKLKRQEKRLSAGAGENRHPLCLGQQFLCKVLADRFQGVLKVLSRLPSQAADERADLSIKCIGVLDSAVVKSQVATDDRSVGLRQGCQGSNVFCRFLSSIGLTRFSSKNDQFVVVYPS